MELRNRWTWAGWPTTNIVLNGAIPLGTTRHRRLAAPQKDTNCRSPQLFDRSSCQFPPYLVSRPECADNKRTIHSFETPRVDHRSPESTLELRRTIGCPWWTGPSEVERPATFEHAPHENLPHQYLVCLV